MNMQEKGCGMLSQAYKDYHGKINFAIKNNSHTQTFLFLREHCSRKGILRPRVLEVGCSNGYFSAALRDNGVYVYGVEPFSDEALRRGRVDDFFAGTVEDFCATAPEELRQTFDAIILGDVLEHLVDPKAMLVSLGSFLKDDGVVLASVPNITHVGIRAMLADGMWDYQKYGILDATHLRFFSWRTLRDLFLEAGFGIERRYNVLVPEFDVYPSLAAWGKRSLRQELDPQDHTFQHVIMASREAWRRTTYQTTTPQHILVLSPKPDSVLTRLRLIRPLEAFLAEHPGKLSVIHAAACTLSLLDWADVVIAHREINMLEFEFLKAARQREIPVIYDTDDLLLHLPQWSLHTIPPAERAFMKSTLALADRVTCTTPMLKKELKRHTDAVHIIPNVIMPTMPLPDPRQRHYSSQCTLVLASSDATLVDGVVPVMYTLLKMFDFLQCVVIGNVAHNFQIPSDRLRCFPACGEEEFSELLAGINNGIGLLPLDDSLFSSCKSPIKFWHYTACGIVSVASRCDPYARYIDDGINGILLDNTPDAWCTGVARLIRDHRKRQILLGNALKKWQATASGKVAAEAWRALFAPLPQRPGKQQRDAPALPDTGQV